jgi:O-antigen/teichoic acid export membrane protein
VKLCFKGLNVKRHLKPVIILLASSISIELYTLLDTTMLGLWCADDIVGYYNNATKLARIINSIISSLALVLLPRLSYYYNNGKLEEFRSIANRVLKILTVLAFPAVMGVAILADSMIPVLFGVDFLPAVVTLRILSVLVMAVALNNFFGTQILMTVGQEKKLLISVVIGAVVNLTMNALLIPAYQHNGAALASAVSEVCVLLATMIFGWKYVRFRLEWRYFLSLALSAGVMVVAVLSIKLLNLPMIIELGTGIVAGAGVYFLCGALLGNEGVREILGIGKRLLKKFLHR